VQVEKAMSEDRTAEDVPRTPRPVLLYCTSPPSRSRSWMVSNRTLVGDEAVGLVLEVPVSRSSPQTCHLVPQNGRTLTVVWSVLLLVL
jgi:hypothetical protein